MCVWFLCFFFKQKTAYEMRISDWSSDVCFSDLPVSGDAEVEDASRDREDIEGRQARFLWRARDQRRWLAVGAKARLSGRGADRRHRRFPEIGRASCRDRVCQYV